MSHWFYVFFGILPSVVWLFYFLRKDVKPESNRMILKIFFLGMLSVLPILLIAFFLIFFGLWGTVIGLMESSLFFYLIFIFFWAGMEEFLKYLVVRKYVLFSSELDEPIDLMLYMIISALGFAALENILILILPWGKPFLIFETIGIVFIRFISATFLHALCSGLVGYFLALAVYQTKKRKKLIFWGLILATFLHGFYNFSIMKIGGINSILIIFIILTGLTIFILSAFKKIKKLKSICI